MHQPLSSELIRQAIAATRHFWSPPELGMVTFVDETKTRRKRDPGRCYRRAGFDVAGRTKEDELLALIMPPERMPPAEMPIGANLELGLEL